MIKDITIGQQDLYPGVQPVDRGSAGEILADGDVLDHCAALISAKMAERRAAQ